VQLILESLCDRGSGGRLQFALNLRLVCKTTRGWVDNNGTALIKNSALACVNVEKEGIIAGFLTTPPPHYITSLRLRGRMASIVAQHGYYLLWSFTNFWSGRLLESLELVDESPQVASRFIETLLLSSGCKRLKCKLYAQGYEFPQFLFQMEHLEVDGQCMDRVSEFYTKLMDSPNLKYFRTGFRELDSPSGEGLAKLILHRKDDRDFKVSISIHCMFIFRPTDV